MLEFLIGGLVAALGFAAALTAALRFLPIDASRPLGDVLAWFVGTVLRARRDHVEAAMRRAGVAAPAATASAMYANLGRSFAELLWTIVRPQSHDLSRTVVFEPGELDGLRSLDRGAVLALAHTANWDTVGLAAARLLPLTVVTKRLSLRGLDWFWQRGRRRRGVRLVSAGSVATGVADALARNELVAMMIDQAPQRQRATVTTRFLGANVLVDLAPALLAMRARRPIALVLPRRRSDGRLTATVDVVLAPPATARREWAIGAMVELTKRLERHVLDYPEQWLWMHRRWKGAPPTHCAAAAPDAGLTLQCSLAGTSALLSGLGESCIGSSRCVDAAHCDEAMACVARLEAGDTCASDEQCASDTCLAGVCANNGIGRPTPCSGAAEKLGGTPRSPRVSRQRCHLPTAPWPRGLDSPRKP